jgi:regulator of protease activity HflC (stomatin/prohibitin superfamily)
MLIVAWCILLVLVAIGCAIVAVVGNKPVLFAGSAVAVIIAVFSWGFASYSPVGTSDTGIVTAFGHTEGDLQPGIHWLPPWKNVTIWDHSVQRLPFEGKDCLQIRIAQQQSACLDVIVFMRTDPAAADAQFQKYKTFPRVQAALFSRGVITSFYNDVFEHYNPVLLASQQTGGTTIAGLTRQVLSNMRTAYTNQAFIVSLNSGQIRYDNQVESALQSVVKATANVNVQKQAAIAALSQHLAAQRLASGGTLTPAVVEQNCINATSNIIQSGGSLPPAWTCTGSGAGVLVNGR